MLSNNAFSLEDVENNNKKFNEGRRLLRRGYEGDIKSVLESPRGVSFLAMLMNNLGYFQDVYTPNSQIYRNAALTDFARRLSEDIDRIDLQWMVKIKQEMLEKIKLVRGEKHD